MSKHIDSEQKLERALTQALEVCPCAARRARWSCAWSMNWNGVPRFPGGVSVSRIGRQRRAWRSSLFVSLSFAATIWEASLPLRRSLPRPSRGSGSLLGATLPGGHVSAGGVATLLVR